MSAWLFVSIRNLQMTFHQEDLALTLRGMPTMTNPSWGQWVGQQFLGRDRSTGLCSRETVGQHFLVYGGK